MKKLTPKQRVLKKYPRAFSYIHIYRDSGGTCFSIADCVFPDRHEDLGMGNTPRDAWAAAARQLKDRP